MQTPTWRGRWAELTVWSVNLRVIGLDRVAICAQCRRTRPNQFRDMAVRSDLARWNLLHGVIHGEEERLCFIRAGHPTDGDESGDLQSIFRRSYVMDAS